MMTTIPGLSLSPRSIFCIGRNYAEHAKELGNAVPTTPIVFLKPLSSLCGSGEKLVLPKESHNIHHETEVVIAIERAAQNLTEDNALSVVAGYAIGIDVTARDLQDDAKKKGMPWTLSKGFPTFAPLSPFVKGAELPLSFSLKINGVLRQQGNTADMIFSIPKLLVYLASVFTLSPGDLIFTGTPSGVGPLKSGDRLEAVLGQGASRLELQVE